MDKAIALAKLSSSRLNERLEAARFLASASSSEDVSQISDALSRETVTWVRTALEVALEHAEGGQSRNGSYAAAIELDYIEEDSSDLFEAVKAASDFFLHEFSGVVGRIDVYGSQEISAYDSSRTKRQVDILKMKLEAITKLSKASKPPALVELDLAELVQRLAHAWGNGAVSLSGPRPTTVMSDESLLEMIISQGLRNAVDATSKVATDTGASPIVVSWGVSDREYWVRVSDAGKGLPDDVESLFAIGTTNKRNHKGYGLPAARQAARSLGGELELRPGRRDGAIFEFRAPK